MEIIQKKSVAPCRGCESRALGCHSTCEKYISWKAEHDRLREEEHLRQSAANDLYLLDEERKRRAGWSKGKQL